MILEVNNLNLQIGNQMLCDNVNFRIKPGEIWGILGPNGCGKTTLLHTLAGLIKTYQGKITLDNKPLLHWSRKLLARHIGILLQDITVIFAQSVYDFCLTSRFPHVNYFCKLNTEDEALVHHALHCVEMSTKKNANMQSLSGGEKRRAQIAAVLTQAPQIFLLDEPTNHLDLRHQQALLKLLQRLAKEEGKSVVMTLHDINHANQVCDHVLLMFPEGHCKLGPTKHLLTTPNLQNLYSCRLQQFQSGNIAIWALDA